MQAEKVQQENNSIREFSFDLLYNFHCSIPTQMNISILKERKGSKYCLLILIQNCNGLPEIKSATAITFFERFHNVF